MEECMHFNMRRANRVLNNIYDGYLQPCGLKGGQFTILRIINRMKTTTNSELQEIMLIDQTTLSRNLKPLIRDGFIEVRPGKDLRVKMLSLTPAGKELYIEGRKCWQKAQKNVKQRLGAKSTEQVMAASMLIAGLMS